MSAMPTFLNGWFPPPGIPLYFWWDIVAAAPLILSLIIGTCLWLCFKNVSKGFGRFILMLLIFLDFMFSVAAIGAAVVFFQFVPNYGQACFTGTIDLTAMFTCDLPVLIAIAAFAVLKAIFIPFFLFAKFVGDKASGGAFAYLMLYVPGMVGLHHWNLAGILVVLSLIDTIVIGIAVWTKSKDEEVFSDDVGAW